jgi:hypothetical protein
MCLQYLIGKKNFFVGILKATEEKSMILNMRIRIRIKTSRIRLAVPSCWGWSVRRDEALLCQWEMETATTALPIHNTETIIRIQGFEVPKLEKIYS